ncbi:MAG: GFA family protein [Paracoccaceae bacterium]
MTDPAVPTRTRRGHCLCRTVRFEYRGREAWRAHCHCESCRRQTASPFTTFMGVPDGAWAWTGAVPSVYRSSPGVERFFCPTCGAPVGFRAERFPGEIHFYAALLEDAADFVPRGHLNWNERLPWIHIADDLPKKEG